METKPTILIVDDERFNINLLFDMLKTDYRTMAARNGELAIKAAHADPAPDLILLDIMMPGMDGYEVCRRLKADETTQHITVIFVTAMGETRDETKGLGLGAVDYITKPISPPITLARIKTHLKQKQQRDKLANLLIESQKQAADLKLANSALDESETLFREMSDLAQDAIVRVDNDGHIRFWNKGAVRIFGYTQDEVVDQELHDIIVPQRYQVDARKGFLAFQDTGQGAAINQTVELVALRKDGEEFPIELSIAPIKHKSKWHAVGIARNITERKRAEERERYAQFQAGITEMGVSVLHNIGNAIMSIINRAEGLQQGSREMKETATLLSKIGAIINSKLEKGTSHIEILEELIPALEDVGKTLTTLADKTFSDNAEKIRKGVEHIAEIVKIQQNTAQTTTHRSLFGFKNLIDDAITMQQDTLEKHGISIDIQVGNGLAEVNMPRSQMLQMLVNLVKNAQEAIAAYSGGDESFRGKITISAIVADHDFIEIQVKDNGCGIPKEKLTEIFRHGYSTKQRGTGFGLHSVSNFVQSESGSIQAVSQGSNQGTEILIRFPQKKAG
ncbi:MAG: PAS domain S-box protein [Magnetococcales bacterium]|nr:PAS domain S-box protein [Magnetococcales bacterium]